MKRIKMLTCVIQFQNSDSRSIDPQQAVWLDLYLDLLSSVGFIVYTMHSQGYKRSAASMSSEKVTVLLSSVSNTLFLYRQ